MPKTYLIVATAKSNLPKITSEAQSLVNVLTKAGNRVILAQNPVTRQELFNLVKSLEQIDVIWIGAHSTPDGWMIDDGVFTARELLWLAKSVNASDIILNTCYSVQFVDTLKNTANVVATIDKDGVSDDDAWSIALYFGNALVQYDSVQAAYDNVVSGSGTQYQFFPKRIVSDRLVGKMQDNELQVAELADVVEKLTRALQGDPFSKTPGLIETMQANQRELQNFIEFSAKSHREISARLDYVETRLGGANYLVLSLPSALAIVVAIVIFTFFVLYGTNMLR